MGAAKGAEVEVPVVPVEVMAEVDLVAVVLEVDLAVTMAEVAMAEVKAEVATEGGAKGVVKVAGKAAAKEAEV